MAQVKAITFYKYQGAGNDFVLIHGIPKEIHDWWERLSLPQRRQLVRKACDRNLGIGGDGLILLHEEDATMVSWDFFNADGSTAEMCGNAARCVGAFWDDMHRFPSGPLMLKTAAGIVEITKATATQYQVRMAEVSVLNACKSIGV